MKNLWLVLCLVLFTPAISHGEDWMYEGKNDIGVRVYLDLDSILTGASSSDIVYFKSKAELFINSEPTYFVADVEFNCKLNEARTTNLIEIEGANSINRAKEMDPNWVKIPQSDIIWIQIRKSVCRWYSDK